ncbi:DUF2029 domain-containing protein [bacterium]|nr:DUF2029 domain-containing protein [bacterium]QQR57180.1 MAG: DUF2029 domain-containing protein [Candidatus Melainabacteria bacterium]
MEATSRKPKLLGNIVVLFYAFVLLVLSWLNLKIMIEQFGTDAFLNKVHSDNMNFIDFTKYYLCGKVAFTSSSHEFYSYPNQKKLFDDLINGGEQGNFPPAQAIEFPPYVLPLMYPISLLAYPQAFQLWTVLNWIGLAVGISVLCRLDTSENNRKNKTIAFVIALAALCAPPILRTFMVGQPTGILFCFFSLYIYFFIKKKDLPAGLFLSLISIKPHYAVFMCIPALVQKRFQLLMVATACEIILLILAVWASNLDGVLGYVHYVIATDTTAPDAEHLVSHMVNLRGMLSIFLPAQALLLLALSVSFLALMACGWLFYKGKNLNWAFALLVLACLFLGPHTHMYDCLLVAIPAALTLTAINQDEKIGILKKLWVIILAIYPIVAVFTLVGIGPLKETYYAFLPYSIFNILLLSIAFLVCFRYSKS